jgi:archaellum component FlaF (FlaF/FlaG flagellin family)
VQRDIIAVLSVAVFAFLVSLAIATVRKRARIQSAALKLYEIDSLTGEEVAEAAGQYVSTVFTDSPLQRVVANGLMHRGQARLSVLKDGLIIDRTGEASIAIPAASLVSVTRASATIDRGTETDGLLTVDWKAGASSLSTNLRLNREDDTMELFKTLNELANEGAKA